MVRGSAGMLRRTLHWLTGQEAAVLLAALGIVLALTVFSKTAGEMLEGDLREWDESILRLMRSPHDPAVPIGPTWLVQAAIDVTALGGTTVPALFLAIVVGYLALEHRYDAIVLVVVAAAGAGLLGEGDLQRVHLVRRAPDHVRVHGLRSELDPATGHPGGDLRDADRGLGDPDRLGLGQRDPRGEAPGAVEHDAHGEAEVLGVGCALESAVAHREVLVAVALEAEVRVGDPEVTRPLEGDLAQLPIRE